MTTELRAAEEAVSADRRAGIQAREIVDLMPWADILGSEWRSVIDVERDFGCSWDVAKKVVAMLRMKRAELKENLYGNQD